LSIEKENVGAKSTNLAYSGSGKLNGEDFTFSGPIKHMNMFYSLGTKFNHDHNYDSLVFLEQPFELEVEESQMNVENAQLSSELK